MFSLSNSLLHRFRRLRLAGSRSGALEHRPHRVQHLHVLPHQPHRRRTDGHQDGHHRIQQRRHADAAARGDAVVGTGAFAETDHHRDGFISRAFLVLNPI